MKKIYFKEQRENCEILKGLQEHMYSVKNGKIVVYVDKCLVEIGSIEEGVISLNEKDIKKYGLEEEANIIKRTITQNNGKI